jgi:hypothetical protein
MNWFHRMSEPLLLPPENFLLFGITYGNGAFSFTPRYAQNFILRRISVIAVSFLVRFA